MSPEPKPRSRATPEWLSAAADGDADGLDQACRAWREGDGATQARWHTYHLIGDVLRSSELAQSPAHDAAFLARLRTRLDAEPVVLAPAPLPGPARPTARWRWPAAAAASVLAVVAVVATQREGEPGTLPLAAVPATSAPSTVAPLLVVDGMVRDARLEEFLRAHQGAVGGIVAPRVDVRPVDVTVVAPAPQR
jgi:sigma-E factor negative regulatory protein RseA